MDASSTLSVIILETFNTYRPNANMADHSVGARDESHESEASQALMVFFDNASPEKSCFAVAQAHIQWLEIRSGLHHTSSHKLRNVKRAAPNYRVFSINLPAFYHECCSLIGYATIYSVINRELRSSVRLLAK